MREQQRTDLQSASPILVATPQAFAEMVDHLRHQSIVALDTESNSLFAYATRTCLIQLSTPVERQEAKGQEAKGQAKGKGETIEPTDPLAVVDYLVDPVRLSADLIKSLGSLLVHGEIEVVMHAAENDMLQLQREFGFKFNRIFDTQLAARFLGWKQLGLAALLESQFAVISDKRMQRTNWGERPLTPQQIEYAQMDTHYLLALRTLQIEQLQASDYWLDLQDAFQQLCRLDFQDYPTAERSMWDMRTTRDIRPRDMGLLEALWEWREAEAQRLNRPPFKLMNDELLVDIAMRQPKDLLQLEQIRGIGHQLLERNGRKLLHLIESNKTRKASQPPPPQFSPEQMLDRPARRRFDKLRVWRTVTAQRRNLAPELVFNNQTLIEIAQQVPTTIADLRTIPQMSDWKISLYGESLLAALR